MHKRQDEIDSKIEDLSTNINTCNEKLEAQAEHISELPTVLTEIFVEMLEDKVEEEKREANLIFFNVPEKDTSTVSD